MAQSEGTKEVVNQAAIQVVTAVKLALKDVDVGPHLVPAANLREPQ